jgi:hypothetical protein
MACVDGFLDPGPPHLHVARASLARWRQIISRVDNLGLRSDETNAASLIWSSADWDVLGKLTSLAVVVLIARRSDWCLSL